MSLREKSGLVQIKRETKAVFVIILLILSIASAYFYFSQVSYQPPPSPPPQPIAKGTISLNSEWKYAVASNRTGREKGYFLADFDDSAWLSANLPWEYAATVDNSTVWFRRRFMVPAELNRSSVHLKFDGVYLIANVWINGIFLGDHAGYFAPFKFNITEHINFGAENVLAVFVYSPVETDLRYKIYVEGIFSDWDCRPYPNWAKDSLPIYGKWFVPGGIWGNVSLIATGPVTIDNVLATPHIYNASLANVKLNITLLNYANETKNVQVNVSIIGHNFVLENTIVKNLSIQAEPNRHQTILFSIDIDNPKLWWPWDQGVPNLYQANVTVYCDHDISDVQTVRFGVRSIQVDIQAGQWTWFINGRKFFPRGSNYISNYFLVKSDAEWLRRDLNLTREANMNMLRNHAHVEPFIFYDLADEMGILIMQDFPLIFAYVDNDYVYRQAETQVKHMIQSLYNHPSIVLWVCHNEPPWNSPWMGDLYTNKVNLQLDKNLKSILEAFDKTRPCIAASGQFDEHLYYGWYYGNWLEYKGVGSGFPTEFGTQALPNLESPFWSQNVKVTFWPLSEQDQRLKFHDYMYWAAGWQYVVGWPDKYPNLTSYITVSQEYQSALLKLAIERFRIRKYNTTSGCLQFLFVDCYPAITWSIVDYYRLPKLAFYAVKNAFNPIHVCIDWRGSYSIDNVYHVSYRIGDTFEAYLYLVNDYPQAFENVTLIMQILTQNETILYEDSIRLDTPKGDGAALKVAAINWIVPPPTGQSYTLRTVLITQNDEILDTNTFTFTSSA